MFEEPQEETGEQKRKPEWLDPFLSRVFFNPCPKHPILRNELKKYCIDCDMPACQYCVSIGIHRQHSVLKIYRHVYKDVVYLHSMEKHMDCSEIQPYKSNKRLVISLNPLPHCGQSSAEKGTCEICKRRLTDADLYKYCSISCKVMAFSRKSDNSKPPFLSVQAQETEEQPPKPRRRSRKGTPRRAPFF
ncbi:hypothetical protein MLD38_033769 [Melastoma candidum]|uniref:Uncharacterized protein n=1 Tax=Melastoma candidum TaxID=119954 RepID=A0ACB9M8E0_9MYRT|nr:hypothetical protein MLD38_033769 [Melastoma candidum]